MKLSIVIPSYNGKHLLERNLPAVMAAAGKLKAEIIIVDDGSTDGTGTWLEKTHPEVKVIRHSSPQRFGKSCNDGVLGASGEVVVLLNNDVEPKADFLIPLIPHFTDEMVFAVSCKEVNFENGEKIFGGRGEMTFKRGLVIHWRPKDQDSSRTMWVSGGSAAFRRDIWLKLGGFDNLFYPAYEEDRDLSWQALKSGYKLRFEPKSVVFHHHETTNKLIFGRNLIEIMSLKNQLLFVWKNISQPKLLAEHIFWLPYHLIVTSFRTKGAFTVSFFWALFQFPQALASRIRAAKHWRIKDEEIFTAGS
jgi:GT2 family glycosyltransferase